MQEASSPAGGVASGSSDARYRRVLLKNLSASARHDPAERRRVHDLVRLGLERVCAANPAVVLADELAILDRQFALLEADPDHYAESVPDGPSRPEPQPSRPRSSSPMHEAPLVAPAVSPVRPTPAAADGPPPARVKGRGIAWAALGLAGLALLAAVEARSCGWIATRCFDSGWIAADSIRSRDIKIPHGLGTPPGRLQLWFSATADGALGYATEFSWLNPSSGNPVNVAADKDNVFIAITGGIPLRSVYSGDSTVWTNHSRGFLRVRAER
jgi:hypothetical protein